jgi:hypothetical protein
MTIVYTIYLFFGIILNVFNKKKIAINELQLLLN